MTLLEQIEHKELINNTLNEIVSIINEERGISDVVSNLTFRIKNTIINAIKNSKSLPINYDEVTFKKGILEEFSFNNKNITIKQIYYSFATNEILNKFPYKIPSSNCKKLTNNSYILNITIVTINGNFILTNVMETIQHELEHIWETSNMQHSYKNMNLYEYSNQLLKEQNEYKKAIGIILYLSQKWEQRAYANGVYQYLINHKYPEHSRLNIKETQLYGGLINLKKSVKLLQSMTEPYQHPFARSVLIILKNNFDIQFEQLIDIGKKTIENIIRILGRTLSKVEDNLSKKEKGEVLFPNYNFINKRFN